MATSDDGRGPHDEADDGDGTAEKAPRRTLIGVAAITRRTEPMRRRTSDDFVAEATAITPQLLDSVLDDIGEDDLDAAFGIASQTDVLSPPDDATDRLETDDEDDDFADTMRLDESDDDDEDDLAATSKLDPAKLDFTLSADEPQTPDEPQTLDDVGAFEDVEDAEPTDENSDLLAGSQPSARQTWGEMNGAPAFSALPLSVPGDLPPAVLDPGDWGDTVDEPEVAEETAHMERDARRRYLTGSNTDVVHSAFEADPAAPKIVTLGGPAMGEEFFATRIRTSVGRGLNNTIVVPDLAMSRQHFEIHRTNAESFRIRDLQSINGTTLNGTKVLESDLFHGDRIEAGKSVFQFVVSGGAALPSGPRNMVPAETRGARATIPPRLAVTDDNINRLVLGASVVALIVAVLTIGAVLVVHLDRSAGEDAEPVDASTVYLEGVDQVKSRNWAVAREKFERAKELQPTLPGIDSQLRRVDRESAAAGALASARELATRGEMVATLEAIAMIPADSVYHAEGEVLASEIERGLAEKSLREANELRAAGRLEEARGVLTELLRMQPRNAEARVVRDAIDATLAGTLDAGGAEAAGPDAGADDERAALATPPPTRPRKKTDDLIEFELLDSSPAGSNARESSASAPNFWTGFALYRARKFESAQRFFDDAAAKGDAASDLARKFAENVRVFRSAFADANTAMANKDWATAVTNLERARQSDADFSPGTVGHFDGELRSKLATAHAALGAEALDEGRLAQARTQATRARNADARNPRYRDLESRLEGAAEEKIAAARKARETAPARAKSLCRDAMSMTRPTTEIHKRARALLAEL